METTQLVGEDYRVIVPLDIRNLMGVDKGDYVTIDIKEISKKRCDVAKIEYEIKRLCAWCDREYDVEYWRFKSSRFCSWDCYKRYYSGENHPCWKGGITSENQKFYHSSGYIEWRKSVFERDCYTCQECGERGIMLNSHHILPFRDYRDAEYSLNVDNGITLCKECHDKTKRREYEFVDRYQKIISDKKGD